MTVDQILTWAGLITAVSGALGVLWRYFVGPLLKFMRMSRDNFETIANALPVWEGLLLRWPDLSGPNSLLDFLTATEARSQANETRIYALLDLKDAPVYVCLPDGSCQFANRAICELFGLSRESMEGSGWLAGIEPVDRSRVWDLWLESIEKQTPYETSYTVRNARTGQRFSATTVAVPLITPGEEVIGYYGLFTSVEPLPETPRPPLAKVKRNIARYFPSRDGKITVTLECGHELSCEDTPNAWKYLQRKPVLECEACGEILFSHGKINRTRN